MLQLMIEILVYLAIATLIGFLLGYLAWGWGLHRKLEKARTEGVASVRTSMDGDSSPKSQLEECQRQRKRLELSLERSKDEVASLKARLGNIEASVDDDPGEGAEEDDGDATDDVLDAEIDFDAAEDEMPSASGWRLFGNGDVDLRISGLDDEETSEPEPEPEPIVTNEPEATPKPAPTSLLTERPTEVDDLKEIKGVGRVMEGVLNDKGVYLFHQIANFSDADVDWVNEAIEAFPGRVVRDNWVGQAKELYRAKYGRSHEEPL
ncbi:MAG: hypothetical protein AAF557_02870 [Pseudomonadota bacterium]